MANLGPLVAAYLIRWVFSGRERRDALFHKEWLDKDPRL